MQCLFYIVCDWFCAVNSPRQKLLSRLCSEGGFRCNEFIMIFVLLLCNRSASSKWNFHESASLKDGLLTSINKHKKEAKPQQKYAELPSNGNPSNDFRTYNCSDDSIIFMHESITHCIGSIKFDQTLCQLKLKINGKKSAGRVLRLI